MNEDMLIERDYDECPRCGKRGATQDRFRTNSLGAVIADIICPHCDYIWTGMAWELWGEDERPDLEIEP